MIMLNIFALLFIAAGAAQAANDLFFGNSPFPVVLPENIREFTIDKKNTATLRQSFCASLREKFKSLTWAAEPCSVEWDSQYQSAQGRPLFSFVFGKGDSNTTLILGGVHPDEITPIYLAFRLASELAQNPDLYANSRVVIAPLINPDGFFASKPSRANSLGVDLNRNFSTKDWYQRAKTWWAERRSKSPGHFPGHIPNSEIETIFQAQLIQEFQPQKIISIHAPLGFYDYDGPGTKQSRPMTDSETKAKNLVHAMSKTARNYRIVEYSFYPGSLGNYAGIERGIPTVTLELESIDAKKADDYWQKFRPSLEQAMKFAVDTRKLTDAQRLRK